jgi:hypothetical protein
MSPTLLRLPLELRHHIFCNLIHTPHAINISLPTISDSQSPLTILSRTCKQLHNEIGLWASPTIISSYLHTPPFGLITPHTTLNFHLTLRHCPILISKIPQTRPEAAIFQLWREIMVKLDTCEMQIIDREIRDRFDMGDERVSTVVEEACEGVVDKRWAEDLRVYGGNRYLVVATSFWGRNRCLWENLGVERV